jgi:hypothetical protein
MQVVSLTPQKVLKTANLKRGSVVTDVLGVSGRAMLGALIQGEQGAYRSTEGCREGVVCAASVMGAW